jgi:hypothetical protein
MIRPRNQDTASMAGGRSKLYQKFNSICEYEIIISCVGQKWDCHKILLNYLN